LPQRTADVAYGSVATELFRASIEHCPLCAESDQSRHGSEMTLCADFVVKVSDPHQVRNYRIQRARRLNQSCATDRFLESMLRVAVRKIFLQQYLP
jgi:hypothetical protein